MSEDVAYARFAPERFARYVADRYAVVDWHGARRTTRRARPRR
ncbi:hypothetical protein [Streptomyces durbertensis]|nr:hypothetical protein [Streptomyces durbertensis]